MKSLSFSIVTSLLLAAFPAFAQPAAAPAADWSVTGNVGLFSEYRFRGISQTDRDPALQGGFDAAHKSGFYLGNWNSNIDSAFFNGANLEMDFYGGYKTTFGSTGLDLGLIQYYYPGSGKGGTQKIDNTEIYFGGSWGPVGVKYYHAVSDFFGFPNSKNSYYLDGSFTHDLGSGFSLGAHVGYQKLKGGARVTEIGAASQVDSIVDYKLGVTKDVSGYAVGLALVGTNRDLAGAAPRNRNVSSDRLLLSVAKTF